MIGAIVGDVIGSRFEHHPQKRTDFVLLHPHCTFTDDTVLTLAVCDALLGDGNYARAVHQWGNAYPHAGYGQSFRAWLATDGSRPYRSFGNGSAMRVAPVGWALDHQPLVLHEAARSASITHDHPEGIKGAQAVALAVFLARNGADAVTLQREIEQRFGYDLRTPVDAIRPTHRFDVSCQGSVPPALRCAIEGASVEEAIRLAVSLGGDADTQAAIAGAVAEARFGPVPAPLRTRALETLDGPSRAMAERFERVHLRSRLQPPAERESHPQQREAHPLPDPREIDLLLALRPAARLASRALSAEWLSSESLDDVFVRVDDLFRNRLHQCGFVAPRPISAEMGEALGSGDLGWIRQAELREWCEASAFLERQHRAAAPRTGGGRPQLLLHDPAWPRLLDRLDALAG